MSKKDFTQVAFNVAQQATSEAPKRVTNERQEAGRKGGVKGGSKRMADMTPEQRKELALKAAEARWAGTKKNAPASRSGAARKG